MNNTRYSVPYIAVFSSRVTSHFLGPITLFSICSRTPLVCSYLQATDQVAHL